MYPRQARFASLILVAALFVVTGMISAQCLTWSSGFGQPGLNDAALAIATYDDGTGPAIYAGGAFGRADGVNAEHLAKWNGTHWASLSTGLDGNVDALAVFDDGSGPALFAGGDFTHAGGAPANHIARWDGHEWSALGAGVDATVNALCVFNDGTGSALYAGGAFTHAGGNSALRIAKWNGSAWSPLGSGIDCGGCSPPIAVLALHVFDDGSGSALYVGGRFNIAGGLNNANSIARWDGTSWSTLGSGFGAPIRALATFDSGSGPRLYAGGDVLVSVWTGSSWASLSGAPNSVYALAVYDDGSGPGLYATGTFSSPAGLIARWNGSTWSTLGSGLTPFHCDPLGGVALSVFDDGSGPALYTGGCFATTTPSAEFLARWNGLAWRAVQELPAPRGFDYYATTATTFDDGSGSALYAGGGFALAGGVPASHVARWTGSSWTPVGGAQEISGPVDVLAVADLGLGAALYAGGHFTSVNGIASPSVAMWNGSHWSPLGTGIAGSVAALAAFDDGTGVQLYAAGYFFAGSGGAASMIRRWNGSTWNEVGLGLSAYTFALVVFDDGSGPALYAGGSFHMAGGQVIPNIARWNGSTWSAVGGGVNDWVFALAVHEENGVPVLIAGGQFTMAGGMPANGVARWDGTSWTPLGTGVNGSVLALASFDDGTGPAVFAGGQFTAAGAVPCANIARWNGSSWSPLGQGVVGATVNSGVAGMAAFDDGSGGGADLYVVGNFSSTGALGAGNIAVWRGCAGPGTMICFGDGSTVPCPCTNNGRDAHGCQNSASTGGAQMHSSGATHPDTVVLSVTDELPSALSIFLQGSAEIAPTAFGDGLRCAGGSLKRLYVKNAVGGATFAPGPGDPPITVQSANLGDPIAPGAVRIYQTYYRDPSLTFCPSPVGNTWNVSNGVRITW